VLAVVNFDLKFTYVLAGWEGSTHDATILNDTMSRPDGIQLNDGKFYLGHEVMLVGQASYLPLGKSGIISMSSL
jgi:hypothetical protein